MRQMTQHNFFFFLLAVPLLPYYFRLAICGGRVFLAGRHFHAEIRRAVVQVVGFGDYKIVHV